jgi:hypothetical protein
MDNESEVKDPEQIQQEMAETRASLTDKVEKLEQQVVGTVHEATSAVSETVSTVKEAVQETVDSVKDTLHDTVEGVRETFNISRQVERHPCLMMGASVAAGYALGSLVLSRRHHAPRVSEWERSLPPERSVWPASSAREEPLVREHHAGPSHRPLLEGLASKFAPEIDRLKGLAIGYLVGAIRDVVNPSLPDEMRRHVSEMADSMVTKLGGQPVHGPVLHGAEGCTHSEQSRAEERTMSGSYAEASARW